MYFAVDASYSANNTYSRPDANDQKYMYYAHVLVGEFTLGQAGLVRAPMRPNSTDLFDSLTNDIAKPIMFVTFDDDQAYPEFLVVFK